MNNFSCEHVADISPLYADGDLEPATVARLERHLSLCPTCTGRLASLRAALAALHAMPDADPGDLADVVMARLAVTSANRRPATPVLHVLGQDGPLVRSAAASPAPTRQVPGTQPAPASATAPVAPVIAGAGPAMPRVRDVAQRLVRSPHVRRIGWLGATFAAVVAVGAVGYALAPRPPETAAVLQSVGLERAAGGWLPATERLHRERGEVWIDGAWRSRDEALRALMALRGVVPREGAWLDAAGWDNIAQGKVLAGGNWVDERDHAATVLRRTGLQEVGQSWLAEEERQGLLVDGRRVDPETWLSERLGAAGYARAGDGRWRPIDELATPAPQPEDPEAVARRWLLANGYALVDGRWRESTDRPRTAAATAGDPQPATASELRRAEQARWAEVTVLAGISEASEDPVRVRSAANNFHDIASVAGSIATTVETLPASAGMSGWRVSVQRGQSITLGTPAVVGGRVHIASGPGSRMAFAFDAATGAQQWSRQFSDPGASSPQPVGENVAYATESCSVYMLSGRTGRQLFGRFLAPALYAMPQAAGDALVTSLPVGGGYGLTALDARNGATGWVAPLPADLRTAPVTVGDRLIAGLRSGTLAAWNLRTGESLWRRPLGVLAPPSACSGGALVRRAVQVRGTNDRFGEVLSLIDAEGDLQQPMIGEPRALVVASTSDPTPLALPDGAWPDLGPAVLSGRTAVAVRGDALEAIDLADGRLLWSAPLGRDAAHTDPAVWTHADPCVGAGQVVIASLDGRVSGLDLVTGRRLWQAVIDAPIGNPVRAHATMYRVQPVLVDGRVYVTTLTGDLVCVDTGDRRVQGPRWWGHRSD